MTVLPAARLRRRAWFDPRIAVGVLLVVGSVVGVVGLVGAQNRTATVWIARAQLVAGDRVDTTDLQSVQVRLGDTAGRYLSGPLPRSGYVVTRAISAGEMVPLSALGTAAGADVASVVVPLSSALSADAQPGATVDLWAAPRTSATATTFGAPVVLVGGATVARIVQQSGFVQASSGTNVELQVPRDDVAAVLQAVADGSRVTAVTIGQAVR